MNKIKEKRAGVKSDYHLTKDLVIFASLKAMLKMMKNAFYSILKAYFVLKIFTFLSRLFGHVEKTARLDSPD